MKVEIFGLAMDAPGLTIYLWSPWRCTLIEHKLFDSLKGLPNAKFEIEPDEGRLHITDSKSWNQALERMTRVLKGWQEEGTDAGSEKRSWRWLIEGDVDENSFDHKGEKTAFWCFLRVLIDRSGPGEEEKFEDLDLEGFGVCVWGQEG